MEAEARAKARPCLSAPCGDRRMLDVSLRIMLLQTPWIRSSRLGKGGNCSTRLAKRRKYIKQRTDTCKMSQGGACWVSAVTAAKPSTVTIASAPSHRLGRAGPRSEQRWERRRTHVTFNLLTELGSTWTGQRRAALQPCGRRERVDWCRSGQISDAERNRGTSSLGFRVECSAQGA